MAQFQDTGTWLYENIVPPALQDWIPPVLKGQGIAVFLIAGLMLWLFFKRR